MRRRIGFGLFFLFPFLLAGVILLPRTGPRKALWLSIAADGQFTVSTWKKHGGSISKTIDLWSSGLTTRKRLHPDGVLASWAHSLTSDGNSYAAVIGDGEERSVVTFRSSDSTRQWARQLPEQRLPVRLHFTGDGDRSILLSDGEFTYVVSRDDSKSERVAAHEGWAIADASRRFFKVSDLYERQSHTTNTPTFTPTVLVREVRILKVDSKGLQEIRTESRTVDEWEGCGVAVSSDGTVASQYPDRIEFQNVAGDREAVPWPIERGKVVHFDPSGTRLLLSRPDSLLLARADTMRVVAELDTKEIGWRHCYFQDESHLLIINQTDAHVSDRIIRWNWIEGTTIDESVGGIRQVAAHRLLAAWVAGMVAWIVASIFLCWRTRRTVQIVTLVGFFLIPLAFGYSHPRYAELRSYAEVTNPAWLTITVSWISLSAASLFVLLQTRLSVSRLASSAIVILSFSSAGVQVATPDGGWFLPFLITALLTTISILSGVHVIDRRSGARSRDARSLPRTRFSIRDLLLLVGANAGLMAVASRFGPFDQSWQSVAWASGSGAALAGTAMLILHTFAGTFTWWKGLPAAIVVAWLMTWAMSQVFWIDSGDRGLILHGSHLAAVLLLTCVTLVYCGLVLRIPERA